MMGKNEYPALQMLAFKSFGTARVHDFPESLEHCAKSGSNHFVSHLPERTGIKRFQQQEAVE